MITVENVGKTLHVFSRDENEKVVQKTVTDFTPYFYVLDERGSYTTIDNKKVRKVFVSDPKKVPEERAKYGVTYEADVVYTNRFLIDRYNKINKTPLRLCYFDIEIESEGGFPDCEHPSNRILSITLYDNFTDKYYCIAVLSDKNTVPQVSSGSVNYYYCEDEQEMLQKFITFFKKTDPDLVIGWNSDNFDIPYIVNRMQALHFPNISDLSRLNKTYSFKTEFGWNNKISGRVLFDLMKAYKHVSQGQRESFSLEYISQYELGEGKEKYEGSLDELYKKDFNKFLQYNIRDVELLVMLNEKLKIVDFFDEIRRYTPCRFEDVFMNSRVVDCLILKFCNGNTILPTKAKVERKRIQGALVMNSPVGLFNNIAVGDLKSLYPSIIISLNLSPEMLVENMTDNSISVGNGVFVSKSKKGILPQILSKLFAERKKYKTLMKQFEIGSIEYNVNDMLQYAVKVLMNSMYGVLVYPGFRLYKREIGDSVTYTGREIIKWSRKKMAEKGYETIYGDTDSLFVKLK